MKSLSGNTKKIPVKNNKTNSFPIVAIGASAGGLEAVTELLKNLSSDTGMTFLYVQHLSPEHESILASLLSKATNMKVRQATHKERMLPDHVYVIPPDKEMNVVDGHIAISPRPANPKINLPIDVLFSSLADKHKENIIGIILSGSATDGTRGLQAIKYAGGVTFAQDDSAKYESMPKSAIAAGVVDFILSPKEIALKLKRISKHPLVKNGSVNNGIKVKEIEIDDQHPDFGTILRHLNRHTGVDFSLYKKNTIKRRIQRRMLLHQIKSLKEYIKILTGKPELRQGLNAKDSQDETDLLYHDLLINVTDFFREPETCRYLKRTLLPRLLKNKTASQPLRIWIPGCSTGEEAYSIAILLKEIQDTKYSNIPIQIFATDLSTAAVNKARVGIYTKGEVENVSPKQLQRFFTRSNGSYRVAQAVRDMCVFAPHNILSDPPFSHLDFISCCNLLIYFDTAAQKKAIAVFHYALNREGCLMLGKSESLGQSTQLFASVNKKLKLFQRKVNSGIGTLPSADTQFSRRQTIQSEIIHPGTSSPAPADKDIRSILVKDNGFENIINSVLLSNFMPASVVINKQMEILQFRGDTHLYLSHSSGKASLNILKMVRPEISFELRNAITKAFKTKSFVEKKNIEINSGRNLVSLAAAPISAEFDEPLLLIVFTEHHKEEHNSKVGRKPSERSIAERDRRIKKMEEEMAAYRDELRAITLNHEAMIEEFQSANEEVVSSNEELRSLNEELETSKEEIQSANEELATTNQELQTRNELLNESYSYSESIIATMHEPMVILDRDLRVKTANNAFYRKFAVNIEQTEGLLLYDLGNRQWNIPKLRELLEDIIPKNFSFQDFEIEHTFQGIGKKIMRLNARRIVQPAHREQLILLAISDVTETAIREREELEAHNTTLLLKNVELEKMNKELQSFNYISSHDLQEPLRKIQTFISRVAEDKNNQLSDKGRDYFNRIRNAAQRMQIFIDDLLAFSRISMDKTRIEFCDLIKIIEEVKSELKEVIEEKKAVVEVRGLCRASVVPFQFQQLMQNLISNSLKFSRADHAPRITITGEIISGNDIKSIHLSKEGKFCHISVKDNGIGFETEFNDRIFELFQRLHDREKYPGTGIGLAIVKKIVENHNGAIRVSSKINKGTVFNIYLPVNQLDEDQGDKRAEESG